MCKFTPLELFIIEKPEISCEEFERFLGDYVEGDLSQTLHEKVEHHLEKCAECQDGLELYNQVIDIARVLGREVPEADTEMPDDVRARLHAKLNQSLGLKLPTRL